jgi:CBS domain-containing protein
MTCLDEILNARAPRLEVIDPNATVLEAIARMARCQIGCLVVAEEGRMVGLLGERDYLQKVVLRGRTSRTTLVREVMSAPALVGALHEDAEECLRRMLAHGVKHLPLVERERVVGLVSRGDIMRALFETGLEQTRAASALSAGTGRFAILDAPDARDQLDAPPDSSSSVCTG